MRSPLTISEATSPKDLPQNGELVSKTKFAQPRNRRLTTTRCGMMSACPAKPKLTVTWSSFRVAQPGSGPWGLAPSAASSTVRVSPPRVTITR